MVDERRVERDSAKVFMRPAPVFMIRSRLVVVTVAAALAVPAFAQKKAAPRPTPKASAPSHVPSGVDEQDIVDLEKHLLEYERAKNSKDVEPWLGDDFQYTATNGQTYSRDQFLNQVKSRPENIDYLAAEDMRVRVYGNVAVVTGVKKLRTSTGDVDIVAKPDGPAPAERPLAFTDVFRRRGSDWELVQEFEADMAGGGMPVAPPRIPPSHPQQPEAQTPDSKPDPDAPPRVSRPRPNPPEIK